MTTSSAETGHRWGEPSRGVGARLPLEQRRRATKGHGFSIQAVLDDDVGRDLEAEALRLNMTVPGLMRHVWRLVRHDLDKPTRAECLACGRMMEGEGLDVPDCPEHGP